MPRPFTFRALPVALAALLVAPAMPAGTSEGDCLEDWTLRNFQSASATYEQPVASASYRGRVTVVLLLSSG